MFECCHKCKPPKRYPGCQDHCPDGRKAKAAHNEKKAAEDHQRIRNGNLYAQKAENVERARKARRRKHF